MMNPFLPIFRRCPPVRARSLAGAVMALLFAVAGCDSSVSRSGSPPPLATKAPAEGLPKGPAPKVAPAYPGPLAAPRQTVPVPADVSTVTLVEAGRARAVLVIPEGGADWEKRLYDRASKEFQHHVELVTGARLEIVPASKYTNGPAVFIGDSPAVRRAGFDGVPVEVEGFRVQVRNGCLAILGHDDDAARYGKFPGTTVDRVPMESTGTLFGVCDVLERFVGVRWYWPGDLGTVAPRRDTLTVPAVHYLDAPRIARRTMWPFQGYPDSPQDTYAAAKRWRDGNGSGIQWNHSYAGWSKLYAESHPEYFALKKDGTHETKYFGGQICFGNPDVLKQEIGNLVNFYEKGDADPWGGWVIAPREKYVPILPPDCLADCQCANCQAALKLRTVVEPQLESKSELIHGYYAKMAAEMKKRWPEKELLIGVYSEYVLPPRTVTYPDNVRIGLCIMDGLAYHRESPAWTRWFDIIDTYRKMTGRPLEIWNYICWPQESTKAPLHFPNLVTRWHREAQGRISGEFVNGGTGRSFALDHLTMYFWYKAMWNPDFDVRAALDEYYTLFYGPAAPLMKEYFELMIHQWEEVAWNVPVGRVGGLPLDKLYGVTYPREVRDQLRALERKALEAVSAGSDYGRRVAAVVAAHQDFYKEAETFDRLGRGYVGVVERGAPKALDGNLDDACWTHPGNRLVLGPTSEPAPLDTRVKFCWDDRALYVGIRCPEPMMNHLVVRAKKQDEAAWNDDGVEIFLSPGRQPEFYSQMAINVGGAVYDGWKPETAGFTDHKNFQIERAVFKGPDFWSMEVRIPYAELGVEPPRPGASWRANVIRARRAGKGETGSADYSCFSPTLGQRHHNTRFFGTLIFTEADRFHEDFGESSRTRWTAIARQKKESPDPDARATWEPAEDHGILSARMSRVYHIAAIETFPKVPVRRGDQLEIVYRGPLQGPGRLEVQFSLQTADGTPPIYGWLADNSRQSGDGPRRFVLDLFDNAHLPASVEQAELRSLTISLSSPPGTENALDLLQIRVSPHTAATVD